MSPSRQKVAEASDLPRDGDRIVADVDGLEVAVFRLDGEYHALANFCPHQSGPLCEGKVLGALEGTGDGWQLAYDPDPDVVACPWHGWRFEIDSGENLETGRYSVPTYDVEREDGEIFVVV